jgi:hypothetical protein
MFAVDLDYCGHINSYQWPVGFGRLTNVKVLQMQHLDIAARRYEPDSKGALAAWLYKPICLAAGA